MKYFYNGKQIGVFYGAPDKKMIVGLLPEDKQESIDFDQVNIVPENEQEKRLLMRSGIDQVADQPALLGTTSDIAGLCLDLQMCQMAAETPEQAAEHFDSIYGSGAYAQAKAMAEQWVKSRAAAEIKMPLQVKGFDSLFDEVSQRATGVANVIEAATGDPS